MKKGKTQQRKQPRLPAPVARENEVDEDSGEFVSQPAKKRPLLLAVSSLLILAWIAFLAVMAFRH
ncbi:MAG: hypothetical protein K8T91_12235 [Planctomycetes bacterium]|nr:hypothetical protein [Planctomycetota bacterium]